MPSEELLRARATSPGHRMTGPEATLVGAGALAQNAPAAPRSSKPARDVHRSRSVLLVPQPGVRLSAPTLAQTAGAIQRVINDQAGLATTVEVTTPRGAARRGAAGVAVHIVNPSNERSVDQLLTAFGVVPDDARKNETTRAEIKASLRSGVGVTLPDERFPERSLIIVPHSPVGTGRTDARPGVLARYEATLILHELAEAGGGEPEQAGPHRIVVDSKGTLPRLRDDEKAALQRLLVPEEKRR